MTQSPIVGLQDFAAALEAGGYRVAAHELAGHAVLLAESAYALVSVLELDDCADVREKVADVQAALTRLAAEAPSPRSWDLYVVVHIRTQVSDPVDELILEEIEADTSYGRKFVRVCIDAEEPNAIDRALRPLLPLRPAPQFDLSEPLDALRSELHALQAPAELVDAAIASFQSDTRVEIA